MSKTLYNPEWKRYLLGNVCNIQIGGTPARNESRFWASNGNGHMWVAISDLGPKWITTTMERITDDGVKHSNVKPVPKGTLLMSFKLTIGRIGFACIDLYTNEAIAAFSPKGEKVWLPWLYYALPSVVEDNIAAEQAIKGQTLNKKKLQNFVLHCPEYNEQCLIAQILDTLDTQIQQTEALIAKLKQMRTGLLHDLLTRGIDENGEVRDPVAHPEEFKESRAGKIPQEWEILQIKEIGTVQLGRQRSPRHQTGKNTTPYLRVANVFDGWIDYSDVLQMDFTPEERAVYYLIPGDILLNEGQSLELVGRSAIYKELPHTYCFQNTLVRFRCNSRTIPEYCQAVFKYWLDTGKFTTVAKQTTSIAHLGADRFAQMSLFVPSHDEQYRIVAVLNAHDSRITTEKALLTKLKQLKKGLMDDLLTGRVRVTELITGDERLNVPAL